MIWIFFISVFIPSGVIFDGYATTPVQVSSISMINGIALNSPNYTTIIDSINKTGLNKIIAGGGNYVGVNGFSSDGKVVYLYDDAPAINSHLESTILKIDGTEIRSINDLQTELDKHSPGDKITLNVIGTDGDNYNKDLILGSNPKNSSLPWLGIGFAQVGNDGIVGHTYSALNFRNPHIYYESKLGDFGLFIYDLLWWIVLISLSVAFVNMLPVGIFDGGRFFYLTVLGITKNKKIAEKLFSFSTYLALFLFFLLMVLWARAFI